MSQFLLDCDVAICAVDDAAGIKIPREVCHSLDRRFVLAGEGHACQIGATVKRTTPDARHTVRDYYVCQTVAIGKHIALDARHTIADRHARKIGAIVERIALDARHAVGDSH